MLQLLVGDTQVRQDGWLFALALWLCILKTTSFFIDSTQYLEEKDSIRASSILKIQYLLLKVLEKPCCRGKESDVA